MELDQIVSIHVRTTFRLRKFASIRESSSKHLGDALVVLEEQVAVLDQRRPHAFASPDVQNLILNQFFEVNLHVLSDFPVRDSTQRQLYGKYVFLQKLVWYLVDPVVW